jgi:hypothetical protein
METQDWLVSYADPQIRQRILPPNLNASGRMADYPHIEGGRHPLKRFELSTPDISEAAKERFYAQNFVDLVG